MRVAVPLILGLFPFLCLGQECSFFGPLRERMLEGGKVGRVSAMTAGVVGRMGGTRMFVPGGSRTNAQYQLDEMGTIDRHIYGTLQARGVAAAGRTDDYEFIRRVTLDLTGRVPLPERVTSFVADTRANKRELLVDELLAKP